MGSVSQLSALTARASRIATALSNADPLLAALGLLAQVTGFIADLKGPDLNARVRTLQTETSALLRSTPALAARNGAILDLVVAEIQGLDVIEDEQLMCSAGEVAAEVLALEPEALAGRIADELKQGSITRPEQLEAHIAAWVRARLEAPLGEDDSSRLAARLAESLMTALWQDESFRAWVGQIDHATRKAFQAGMCESQRRVHGRLGRLIEMSGATQLEVQGLRELLNCLAARLGRPSEVELDQLVETCQPLIRDMVAKRLRESLCSPLDNQEVQEALRDQGPEVADGPEWPVPPLFSYLPHGLARQPGDEQVRPVDPGEWPEIDHHQLRSALCGAGSGHRLLVIGPAGFGKTTFLHCLALELMESTDLLVLPPISLREWPGDVPSDLIHLLSWQAGLHKPEQWTAEQVAKGFEDLLDRGRLVLLIDGLDQLGDGLKRVREAIASYGSSLRTVAACRQELSPQRTAHGFDHVVALRAPSLDGVDESQVPEQVRQVLERAHDDEADRSHPFWIHVARYLVHIGAVSMQRTGVTSLLGEYLDQLLRLGATRRGQATRSPGISPRQRLSSARQVLVGLGLDSLRLAISRRSGADPATGEAGGPEAPMQEIAAQVLTDDPSVLARRYGLSEGQVESGIQAAVDDALVVSRGITDRSADVFVFHHQLIQEHLAAVALVDAIDAAWQDGDGSRSARQAVAALARLAGDIVQPRRLSVRGGSSARFDRLRRGAEIPSRVVGLKLWSFVVDQLIGPDAPLRPDERGELARAITDCLWEERAGGKSVGGICRSALMRIRDELLERDQELQQWLQGEPADKVREAIGGDSVWDQLDDEPDAFMVLHWVDERHEHERRMRVAPSLEELAAALEVKEEDRGWTVRRDAHLVVAEWSAPVTKPGKKVEPERWFLVPPGQLLVGGFEYEDELPVRRVAVDEPYWVAEDPVTIAQYERFVDAGGYDLDQPWWDPVREEARKALARDDDRRAPWQWQEQRARELRDAPVTGVCWFEAFVYCRWLSRDRTGSLNGPYRLPTELEWEAAARGSWGRRWPWGCSWRPSLAVCAETEDALRAEPVEKNLNRSAFGARGLVGNVFEWISTRWQQSLFGGTIQCENAGDVLESDLISRRGGSFYDNRDGVRCAYRLRDGARVRLNCIGFRCARDVR